MTCAFLTAMLVPAASADGVDRAADAVEDETGINVDRTTNKLERMWIQMRDQLLGEAEARQGEAEAAIADVEAEVEATLEALDDALGATLGQVDDLKRQAEGQVPPIHEVWGQRETGQGYEAPSEYAPQSTVSEPFEFSQPLAIVGATAAAATLLFWLVGSSSAAKAGAATASTSEMRRLLPYASPMFTRFERDTVLGHPKREALYGLIMTKPGVTLQDLCEETGLSRTAVSHHLRLLEQQHLIVSKRMGRSRHFFENGGRYGRDQKEAYAILHNDRSKDVHSFIETHPGAIQKDLCEALDIQASVAHWHVKRLQEASLIEAVRAGRTVSYFPTTPLA